MFAKTHYFVLEGFVLPRLGVSFIRTPREMSDALMIALGISLASLGATGLGVLVCVLVWRKMTTLRIDQPVVFAQLDSTQQALGSNQQEHLSVVLTQARATMPELARYLQGRATP